MEVFYLYLLHSNFRIYFLKSMFLIPIEIKRRMSSWNLSSFIYLWWPMRVTFMLCLTMHFNWLLHKRRELSILWKVWTQAFRCVHYQCLYLERFSGRVWICEQSGRDLEVRRGKGKRKYGPKIGQFSGYYLRELCFAGLLFSTILFSYAYVYKGPNRGQLYALSNR